jgi:hypothetical protein
MIRCLRTTGDQSVAAGHRVDTARWQAGLDEHPVRRWRSWYRWITLALLADAFLVVAAVTEQTPTRPAGDLGHRLRGSLWRRRYQARARACHYHRQASGP